MPILRFVRDNSGAANVTAGRAEPIPFVAVTAGVKGDGIDTSDLPWSFGRGEARDGGWHRFPLLWVHDFGGHRLPLGVTDVRMRNDGTTIEANAIFDPDDTFAVEVERKYLSDVGGLRGFSASWDDVNEHGVPVRGAGGRAVAHELLEVSAVPVGMDPLAIKEKRADALRGWARELIAAIEDASAADDGVVHFCEDGATDCDCASLPTASHGGACGCPECAGEYHADYTISYTTGTGPSDTLTTPQPILAIADDGRVIATGTATYTTTDDEDAGDDVAAEMVAVFDPASDDSDAARARRYRALLPAYRRLGWTAPELLPVAELALMDADVWRGLFVSGELERVDRAGKELSTANLTTLRSVLDQLSAAVDTLNGLVARVDSGADRAEELPSPDDIARAILDSVTARIERA